MPSNFQTIDNNFPTFTGKETPQEQIRALHDYLFQLRESLRYSLNNLSADNFNNEALKNMTDAQSKAVEELLKDAKTQLGRMETAVGTIRRELTQIEESINGEAGIQSRINELAERTAGIAHTEEGTIVGEVGQALHLIGAVYINGVLYGTENSGGTESETT